MDIEKTSTESPSLSRRPAVGNRCHCSPAPQTTAPRRKALVMGLVVWHGAGQKGSYWGDWLHIEWYQAVTLHADATSLCRPALRR